jgi:hypothetical protein
VDDICPPACPCRAARWGVALLTWCVYSAIFAPVFFGTSFATVFAAAMQGDIPMRWAGAAVIGLLSLFGGLYEIRRHGHEMHLGSVVWSVLVVGFVGWLLFSHGGSLALKAFDIQVSPLSGHVVRAVMWGWAVSNIFNLFLQLRDVFRRRPIIDVPSWPVPRVPRMLLRRRWVTIEDEIEGHGIEALLTRMGHAAMRPPPRVSPADIEHDGALPQIAYVRQPDGSFIEVHLPDAVPDRRR